MNELICPYCNNNCYPDDEYREEDKDYEHECEHCGKYFNYSIQYYSSYTSNKAPCLNGEEHNYQQIKGFPEEYLKNRYRCSWCGDEKIIKDKE
jgi:uncharacterized Zn finger protein